MIALKKCPICSALNIALYSHVGMAPSVKHEIMPNILVEASIITKYFVCQNCYIIFQNPRFSNTELNKFYRDGYYRNSLNLTDKQKNDDEKRRAKIDHEIITKNIGEVQSHLDIGCSRGYLLDLVNAKVKVGVEVDDKNVTAKNIKVYSDLNKVKPKLFDLITMIHTLEHVSDPVGSLKSAMRFLNKNGHLLIEVPTWKSPGGPLRLAHLYHFEPDVLRLMCMKVGLEIVHTEFTPHLLLICQKNNNLKIN